MFEFIQDMLNDYAEWRRSNERYNKANDETEQPD